MRSLPQWLSYIQSVHHRSVDLGLVRIAQVAERLALLPVPHMTITVAGTNGKGSSVELLTQTLTHAGHRTGSYTSPHLLDFRERIQIDGVMIPEDALCRGFAAIERARGEVALTYFEFSTLAALWWFRKKQVDVAVLETGMGGRLDAVNIVDADIALITNIDIDHAQWLGADRKSIAIEKAGILRRHKPAVCSDPQAPEDLLDYAADQDTPLYILHRDFEYRVTGSSWNWLAKDHSWADLPLPKPDHGAQLDNASGVLMVLLLLADQLPVSPEDITAGLRAGPPVGRGQQFDGPPKVILDVAHNTGAVRLLTDRLQQAPVAGITRAVFAALQDKPIEEMIRTIAPLVGAWYLTSLDTERAVPVAELRSLVQANSSDVDVMSYSGPVAAFNAAKSACKGDDRICVFGSFYLVGDILAQRERLGI